MFAKGYNGQITMRAAGSRSSAKGSNRPLEWG